jgi:triacylglycerol lipase
MLMLVSPGQSVPADAARDKVVLVHGMGRTKRSMNALASHLSRQGFRVINFGYPSTRQSVETSTEQLREALQRDLDGGSGKIHFVTHSLGGIVVRALLKAQRPDNLGHVVMLSPPNQGSEVADRLRHNVLYKWATGRAGQQLGTEAHSVPNQLGGVDFPVGVITGSRSWNPLFSLWIDGPSDGKVGVARARVAGMADFLVVPRSHTYIMRSRGVMAQVARFLREGRFEHQPA